MFEIVPTEQAEKEFTVVIFYLDGGVLNGFVFLEVGHEESQHSLAGNDDKEEIDSTHEGAISGNENISGIFNSQRDFQRGEIGITACVKSCQHASDIGKEGRVAFAIKQKTDGDGDGASEESEKGGFDETGRQLCPCFQVGRQQEQRNGDGDGDRSDGGLQGMHFFRVRNHPCESEGATSEVGNDDAAHLVEPCAFVGEPENEEGREYTK